MSAMTHGSEFENAASALTSRAPSAIKVEANVPSTMWARFLAPYFDGVEPVCASIELPAGLDAAELMASFPEHAIAREYRNSHSRTLLLETNSFAALIQWSMHGSGSATVRAASTEAVDKAIAEIGNWFPIVDTPAEKVSIDFWQKSSGMYTTTRTIEAPDWTEVTHHYPSEVQSSLAALVSTQLQEPDGRVLLWHGPPGTGKTSAIRSLARSWRSQARFQVVLDPEPVFSNAASLMQVVLDEDGDDESTKWRVLVIEDADEIVRADNDRTSQSLSRLLNIGDGIVGQGLKVLILLTTNEPPSRLHPALTRPGRCMSEIFFRRFRREEAAKAFPDRDIAASGNNDLSLAEILTGRREVESTERPGLYL